MKPLSPLSRYQIRSFQPRRQAPPFAWMDLGWLVFCGVVFLLCLAVFGGR